LYDVQKIIKIDLLGNKLQFDVAQVYLYAKKKGLDVVYVASQGRSDDFEKTYPTIEEWLHLIEHAEMVVTNSFHGTVFSMIFRKKFATLLLTGTFAKMNDRIVDLLTKYALNERILSGNLDEYEKDVDYTVFDEIICKDRDYVRKKLREIIG
jgi:hypothetical protein